MNLFANDIKFSLLSPIMFIHEGVIIEDKEVVGGDLAKVDSTEKRENFQNKKINSNSTSLNYQYNCKFYF